MDGNGQVRMELNLDDAGLPSISLKDPGGRDRLYAMLDETGAAAIVLRGEQNDVADIGVTKDGEPQIRLYDAQGTMRSAFYIRDDRPAIKLYDRNDAARLAAFLQDDGCPTIEFCAANKDVQATLTVAANGDEGLITDQPLP